MARYRIVRWAAGCLIVLACLCCLLTSGTAAWLWKQYTAYPSDPAALAQVVQKEVQQMRGLEFKSPVTPRLMTPDKLRERLVQKFEQEWPREKAHSLALTLAALDLLDPKTDLYQLYLDLYTEQISGFYDPETRELYIVSDASRIGVVGRMTLAHELTHALQDQHYDLQKLGYGKTGSIEHDSEYLAGLQGLVEGDATLLQSQYMQTFSPLDWVRFVWEYSRIDTGKYNQAPPVISAGLTFPYTYGGAFVKSLYASGGWAAVNAAFSNPPRSTEQILHPYRYRQSDAPQLVSLPPLTDTLGIGWQLVDEDVIGEFYTQLHLAQHLSQAAAINAAKGWGGDRYATYYNANQETIALAWHSVWDNEAEANEFVDAYDLYLSTLFNHSADTTQDNQSCWQKSQDYRCLKWQSSSVIVVRGPDANTVERMLQALQFRP